MFSRICITAFLPILLQESFDSKGKSHKPFLL